MVPITLRALYPIPIIIILLLQPSPPIRMHYVYHVTTCYMLIMPGPANNNVIIASVISSNQKALSVPCDHVLYAHNAGGPLMIMLLLLQSSPPIRMQYLYHVTTCCMLIMPGPANNNVIIASVSSSN